MFWTYSILKIRKDRLSDIRGQEKGRKDQKLVSHLPRFVDFFGPNHESRC